MKDFTAPWHEIIMVHVARKGWVTLVLNCRIALSHLILKAYAIIHAKCYFPMVIFIFTYNDPILITVFVVAMVTPCKNKVSHTDISTGVRKHVHIMSMLIVHRMLWLLLPC